jgi:hypothetical protein
MLDKEFQFYLDNQNKLLEKYNNRYVVIVGTEVVGDYDSSESAYFNSRIKYTPGTFLIQKCTPGEKDYTLTYYTPRVDFAHIWS